jgi:hypothetical protein
MDSDRASALAASRRVDQGQPRTPTARPYGSSLLQPRTSHPRRADCPVERRVARLKVDAGAARRLRRSATPARRGRLGGALSPAMTPALSPVISPVISPVVARAASGNVRPVSTRHVVGDLRSFLLGITLPDRAIGAGSRLQARGPPALPLRAFAGYRVGGAALAPRGAHGRAPRPVSPGDSGVRRRRRTCTCPYRGRSRSAGSGLATRSSRSGDRAFRWS